ncbi:MAG TPA: biotin transporter BioY [Actinoplanes sp.]|nr:biotin transporter BioY [Actinoplanes sp.]
MSELTIGRAGGRGLSVLGDLLGGTAVRDAALVTGGAVLVGVAAQVAVPVPGSPVPITGQTFAVLLCGATLGLWRGAASMVLYVAAGLLGVPWFAKGASGLPVATFGYLVGFVVAAALVGRLAAAGGDRNSYRTLATMAAGSAVIYLFGVPWLAVALGVDLRTALGLGLVPYLLGDALKALLAAGLLPGAWWLLGRTVPAGRPSDR